MLLIQVPNSSGLSVPAAPKLNVSAHERAIMAAGSVYSVIDPASNPAPTVYIRGRVGSSSWRHTGSIENRAEMNGQPAVILPTAAAQMAMTAPFAPAEYTLICPVRVTADGQLLGIGAHRVKSSGNSLEGRLAHNASIAISAALGAPSVGTTRLIALSWSAAAKTMALAVNGAAPVVGGVQASDTNAAYPVGGVMAYNSATDGASAIFGEIIVLSKAAHIEPRPTKAVLAALAAKYGIALAP